MVRGVSYGEFAELDDVQAGERKRLGPDQQLQVQATNRQLSGG